MAKSRTISFDIIGNDQLSRVLANAQKNLKGLTSATLARHNKALANAQATLKDVEAYKKLQAAVQATKYSQLQVAKDQSKFLKQRQEAVAQLDAMKSAFAQLKDAYKANWLSMPTKDALAMKEQIRNANAELKAQAKVVQNLDRAYDALPARTRQLQAQLDAQRTQLSTLRQRIPTGNLAAAESALRSQIDQTTAALNREIAALERRNQIHSNFTQRQQDLSNAYSNFQSSLDTAQTLMNPFTSATQKAIDFQATMDTLKSISQMDLISQGNLEQAEKNMARLRAQAKEIGATTIFTSQEAGEAQVYVARTGWDTDAIEAAMPHLTRLAAANRTTLERTADIAINVMTAFGHGAKDVARDADIFNYTVNHSNQTLEQFGMAMSYAAPVAKLFGATLEETAMMTKFASDAGVQASRAGTSIRQTMLRLVAPPKKASKAMDELGVSTSDATKEWNEANEVAASYGVTLDAALTPGRQFIHIMEQLDRGMAGRSDQEKLAALSAITGINAVSGAANIFGAGADKAKNFTELLENCRGSLEQTYAVMTDNAFGAQKSFESAWDALQLSVGDSLLDITTSAYQFAAPLLTSLSQFVDRNPAVVKGLAAIAAAASTAIVGLAGFSLAMAGIRFAQAGIATAGLLFADLGAKVAAAKVALSGLGAGIVTRLSTLGTALSGLTLSGAIAGIKSLGLAIAGAARAGLAFMFTPIGAALTAIAAAAYFAYKNWDKVSAAFSTLGNALSTSLGPAFSNLGTSLEGLMTSLSPLAGVFENLGGVIISVFIGVLGTVGSLLSGLAVLVTGLFSSVAQLGTGIVDAFAKIKDGDFAGAFDALTQQSSAAADAFKNSWLDAANAVKSGLQGTDSAIQQLWTTPQISGGGVGAMQAQIAQVDTTAITQPIADASTQTAASLTNVQMPAQATGQSLTPLPPAIDGATSSTTQLAAALPAPIGGLDALGSAASSAAGALESAAARINSIQINVPQVNYIPMNVPTPVGKGFAKGGFVSSATNFFAGEHGAEAIVPLNHSQRSYDIWSETGDLLGFNQDTSPINISLTVNVAGNADKDTAQRVWTEALKPHLDDFAARLADFNHERRRRSFV